MACGGAGRRRKAGNGQGDGQMAGRDERRERKRRDGASGDRACVAEANRPGGVDEGRKSGRFPKGQFFGKRAQTGNALRAIGPGRAEAQGACYQAVAEDTAPGKVHVSDGPTL